MNEKTEYYDDEIELIDIFRVLWKRKMLIFFLMTAITVTSLVFLLIKYPKKIVTRSVISLNFDGIQKGVNPDGTVFDKNQIISPLVMNNAMNKVCKSFPLIDDKLRQEIIYNSYVDDIIPDRIKMKIEEAQKKGEVYQYVSNEYTIVNELPSGTLFTQEIGNKIVEEIISAYTELFFKKYGEEPLAVIDISDTFLENNDYGEVIHALRTYAERLVGRLNTRTNETGFFKSKHSDETFTSLKDKLSILMDIHISRLAAVISIQQTTKNSAKLIQQYKYKINEISKEKEKFERKAKETYKLLQEFIKPGNSSIKKNIDNEYGMSGSNLVIDSSFIENLKKESSISYLLKEYLAADIASINQEVEIDYYNDKIKMINANIKETMQVIDKPYIEKELKYIKDKIIEISNIADIINKEYLTLKYQHAVTVQRLPETNLEREKNIKLFALLACMASFFCAVFFAFFVEYISSHSIKKT
jgi:hypothetical protein